MTTTSLSNVNSSQVIVYNITDNRSSLSITDLTSDGEYSVTVAGKDGAGQLGEERKELTISWTGTYYGLAVAYVSNWFTYINAST